MTKEPLIDRLHPGLLVLIAFMIGIMLAIGGVYGATAAGRADRGSVDVRDTSLPLSGAGKVLKTLLREPFWSERDKRVN